MSCSLCYPVLFQTCFSSPLLFLRCPYIHSRKQDLLRLVIYTQQSWDTLHNTPDRVIITIKSLQLKVLIIIIIANYVSILVAISFYCWEKIWQYTKYFALPPPLTLQMLPCEWYQGCDMQIQRVIRLQWTERVIVHLLPKYFTYFNIYTEY